jgi:hypothetical protein
MGTDFMFYNVTRGNQKGEWPDDYCAIRNMERYGEENARRGFRLVIERNAWAAQDMIVAVGDSFGALLTYENDRICGLDDGEPVDNTWHDWLSDLWQDACGAQNECSDQVSVSSENDGGKSRA